MLSILSSIGNAWSTIWPFLVAILFFGIVIMVHECGHFIAAKACKVKVNEFAMGMGPKILSFGKKETKYSLRLLPIGGFVSMEGEDEDSNDNRAFNNKSVWKRIVIVSAGALVNIFLGLIIVAIMLSVQDGLSGTRQVFALRNGEESVTELSGLKVGDEILKVDGKNIFYYEDIYYLLQRDGDGVTDITVRRGGEKLDLSEVKITTADLTMLGVDKTVGTVFKDTFKDSVSICRMVWLSLFDMITGRYGLKDMSGPVGIVNTVAEVTEYSSEEMDFGPILKIMALITINVGIFNLLPIPALDGGRLLFMAIEIVRRKPIDKKYEGVVHAVGMALLLLFMLIISLNDIITLVKG